MQNSNVITNRNGQVSSIVGDDAIKAFALRSLIDGLRFEAKSGMKLSRVSLKKIAKAHTGLKINNAAKLIAALEPQLEALLAKCDIIDEVPAKPDQPGEAPRCTVCGQHRDAARHLDHMASTYHAYSDHNQLLIRQAE